MKNFEELKTDAEKMQRYLELKVDENDEKIIKRMEMLQILIAKSGNLLADAKFLQDKAKLEAIKTVIEDKNYHEKSTTFINKFVDACGKDFNHLVTWIDRINSAAGKQHQGLITILSFRKEQMKMV